MVRFIKKVEFSKKWLTGCICASLFFTLASYILSALDKQPLETLSGVIIETLWGTSGVSFAGYALQNSVRAYTSAKFGIPKEDLIEEKKEIPSELDEMLRKIYERNG